MSRFLCRRIVVWLVILLLPAVPLVIAQVPDSPPVAEEAVPAVPAPAVPAVPEVPPPPPPVAEAPVAPAEALTAPQLTVAPASLPVINSVVDAAAHQRIEEALNAAVEADFQETPLSEVMASLQETHKIPILIDRRALDNVGLGTDTPVSIQLKGASLRSLLRLMLHEMQLTFVVREQVLKITTPEEADEELVMRWYFVADLAVDLPAPLVVGEPVGRYSTVQNLITSIVAPNSWDEVGGAGSVVAYEPWGSILVSQIGEVHEAVESLLTTLRKAREQAANTGPGGADYTPLNDVPAAESAARAKIVQALDQVVNVDFCETPLREVAQHLADAHGIQILLDRKALDDVGLGSDTPVTFSMHGVTLRCALRHLLSDLELEYVITNEILRITTPECGERESPTLIYPVSDFVSSPPQLGGTTGTPSGLADLTQLIQTVSPNTWDSVGGAGVIEAVEPWGILVISQAEDIHEDITALLQTARRARQQPHPAPVPVPPVAADAMILKQYVVPEGCDIEQVIKAIQGCLAPATWGPEPQQGAIYPVGRRLLIRQTPIVHAAMDELLNSLYSLIGGGMGGAGGMGGFF